MDKEEEIISLKSRLAEKEQEVESLIVRVAEKEKQISKITSTLGWRMLSRYGRIKHKYLLPVYNSLRSVRAAREVADSFLFGLDTLLPEELVIGKGNALYIAGWCFHTTGKIKKLEVLIDGLPHRVKVFKLARRDVMDKYFPRLDPKCHSYRSGFWTTLAIAQIQETVDACLELKAVLRDGRACVERIGKITFKAEC